jgi:peroxiredoxin
VVKEWGRLLAAGAAVFFVITGALLWVAAAASSGASGKRRTAPDFALKDQNGRTHRLHAYSGRVVFVTVAPLDHPDTLPTLRALRDSGAKLDDLGIKTFALCSSPEPQLAKLYQDEDLGFPLLQDTAGRIAHEYQELGNGRTAGRPTTYLVGPEGRIVDEIAADQPDHHVRLLLSAARCCMGKMQWTGGIADGRKIQNAPIETADGKPDILFGKHPGKATVLYFVSTECPCSRSYEQRLKSLATEFAPRGARFVALFPNRDETPSEIRSYATAWKIPFPAAQDKGGAWAKRLGAKVTPEAFVLDAEGRLRYQGRIDDSRDPAKAESHELRDALSEVVAGRLPTHASGPLIGCAINLEGS